MGRPLSGPVPSFTSKPRSGTKSSSERCSASRTRSNTRSIPRRWAPQDHRVADLLGGLLGSRKPLRERPPGRPRAPACIARPPPRSGGVARRPCSALKASSRQACTSVPRRRGSSQSSCSSGPVLQSQHDRSARAPESRNPPVASRARGAVSGRAASKASRCRQVRRQTSAARVRSPAEDIDPSLEDRPLPRHPLPTKAATVDRRRARARR